MDATELQNVVIVDDADLVLVCDGMALHVSSWVLRSASPTFEAMFGPNFSEGQAVRRATRDAPAIVLFPDDDVEALESLCYALHHQRWRCTSGDIIEPIVRFAIAVDKYHCQTAVQRILIPLIYDLDPSPDETGDLTEGIYLLNDPSLFQRYTSFLVERNHHEDLEEHEFEGRLEGLQEALYQRERDGIAYLSQEIDRVVDCILPAFIRSHRVHPGGSNIEGTDEENCDYDQRAAGRYLERFMAHWLWPSSRRASISLRDFVAGIRDIEVLKLHESEGCANGGDDGKIFREIVNPKLEMLKMRTYTLRVGLCLDCFNARGAPHEPCQIPHDEFVSEDTQLNGDEA